MSCVSWRIGAIHFQNPIAMSVPVTHAATKPARDLRGARGRRRNGRREGSRGVTEPSIRPTVDAAVSAQDNLEAIRIRHGQGAAGDVHEDGYGCNIEGVDSQCEVDTEDVPYDAIYGVLRAV